MDNQTLTLYKASAGSGKTFTLAVSYIALLVKNAGAFTETLAVTFTNKATAEMKQRILTQLYGISRGLSSSRPYLEKVSQMLGHSVSDDDIRERCRLALERILQDYGHFRIETIDSFFQSILRSLARELQLGGSFTIELDTDKVISEAVDRFLDSIGQDSKAIGPVISFIEDNIENDKVWSISDRLKKFSKQLFHEFFQQNSDLLEQAIQDKAAMESFRKELNSLKESTKAQNEQAIKAIGQQCLDLIGDIPLTAHAGNLVKAFANASFLEKKADKLGLTIDSCASNPDELYAKTTLKKYGGQVPNAAGAISSLFQQAKKLYIEHNIQMNSLNCALNYLHEMGLIVDIRREIDLENREQGRFVLADTASLLNRIKDGDTSFVFEKTGSFTRHLMIDEFQDTSRLQWNNLCLLLGECLSQGGGCLVVGDVKQSIYRWRGSDWNILNTEIERDMAKYRPKTECLTDNRRSEGGIIDFNNCLFPSASTIMSSLYREQFGMEHKDLETAYSDVVQGKCKDVESGWVHVVFPPSQNERNELCDSAVPQLVEAEIDRLVQSGVNPNDITVLCRNNKDIQTLAQWFTAQCTRYKVTSAEAFKLGASYTVRIVTNIMRWLENRADTASLAQAVWEWQHHVEHSSITMQQLLESGFQELLPEELKAGADMLKNLNVHELAMRIYSIFGLERAAGQAPFNMSFMDCVKRFITLQPCDLAMFNRYWETELCDKSIPETARDGILLMTIHKSKGLEFHSVIIPYCNWQMVEYSSNSKSKQLWIKPQTEPFNHMPMLPVEFSKALEMSAFHNDFRTEASLQAVDNMNLLYVAMTRPKCNLSVICYDGKTPQKRGNPLSITAGCLIKDSLLQARLVEESDSEYEHGSVVASASENGVHVSDNPFEPDMTQVGCNMTVHPMQTQFRESGEADRFIHMAGCDGDSTQQDSFIETGKLMHALFSRIATANDIDSEVDAMLWDGLLDSHDMADKLKAKVRSYINGDMIKDWFSGRYTLFNETPVLFRQNGVMQNRRPDRVMVLDGAATVVDFKFGSQREEYLHQVAEYAGLLEQMGYCPVHAYIWYVYTGQIVDALNR